MPSRRRILSALAPAALVLLAPAGCGGGDEPTSARVATTTVTKTVTVPATTPATGTTSTVPDERVPITVHEAEQVLDARGFAPLGERDWRQGQALKVLLGISRGAGPRAERAFFFVYDVFIGTDTSAPSAKVEVVAQEQDAITLSYGLYRPSDSVDAPTGGSAEVTYRWDGTRLVPQDPIPTADPGAPLSRR